MEMRRISSYDADQCAEGANKKCSCRCNGSLHGKSHAKLIKFENDLVEKGKVLTQDGIDSFLKQ